MVLVGKNARCIHTASHTVEFTHKEQISHKTNYDHAHKMWRHVCAITKTVKQQPTSATIKSSSKL